MWRPGAASHLNDGRTVQAGSHSVDTRVHDGPSRFAGDTLPDACRRGSGRRAALRRAAGADARGRLAVSRDWVQFLTGALLLLGAGLLLSGIVCFFAFNWADLGRFAKFGVLEAAVAICAGLGWWKLSNLSGRVALFAAAVLVGPLLGVYGQTYQTGADPWGLFAFWALLILPWVVAARFTACGC